jgi:hypothetical protein
LTLLPLTGLEKMYDFRITHPNKDGKSTSLSFSFSNDQGCHVLERKTSFLHQVFLSIY